jgi:hypothetical protein
MTPKCSQCHQPLTFVRDGVYQCLTGEFSRSSCPLFGKAQDENGQLLPPVTPGA